MTVRSLSDGYCFGKYQIVRLIAVGGMSEVYEAVHSGLDKRVALKVLRPELADSVEARERFICEGVNAARIRHTHVVDVTDVGVVGHLPYLVMSLLDGEDLGAVYERRGRLPIADLVDVLLPVACAVAAGHAQGVVHRDLKPDNVFLHREGCRVIPKVLDFGVSWSMHNRRITPTARVFGTPHYMSPEQARGTDTDAQTDQYALGVMLYEGVTGHLPRDSSNPLALIHAVAFQPFPPPSIHLALPPGLEAVILRAMEHDREARFASMTDLAFALLPFANESAHAYWSVELTSLASVAATAARTRAKPRARGSDAARVHVTPVWHPAGALAMRDASKSGRPQVVVREPSRARDSLQPQIAAAVPQPKRRQRSMFWLGATAGAVIALSAAWLSSRPRHLRTPASVAEIGAAGFEVDVHVAPPTAAVLLDGKQVAIGHFRARLPRDGSRHELRALATGFITRSLNFRDEPPPREIYLTPTSSMLEAQLGSTQPPAAANRAQRVALRKVSSGQAGGHGGSRATPRDQMRGRDAAASAAPVALVDPPRPNVRTVETFEPRLIEVREGVYAGPGNIETQATTRW